MPAQVRIPAVLRTHVEGARTLEVAPGTLRAILEELGSRYPALDEQVFAEDRDLHRFVNIYLNDEDVRYLEGLETKVAEGDVVSILPAVAGG